MPDQWGRPTLEDGLKLTQFGMQIGAYQRQEEQFGMQKELYTQSQQERLTTEQALALYNKEPGADRDAALKTLSQTNPIGVAKASSMHYQSKLNDINFRKAQFDLAAAKAQDAKRAFTENISRAEAMESTGNTDAAIPYYIEAYKYINNGDNIQYDAASGKAFQMVPGESGELVRGKEVPLPTRDQMQKMARDMLESTNFEKMYVSQRLNNKAVNAAAVQKPVEVVDAEGNHAGWGVKGVDPDMGTPDYKVGLEDGRMMSFAEARKKGYQFREDWAKERTQNLGIAKAEAELAHTQALTKKTGVETKTSLAPEEKLADFYVRAGLAPNITAAADMVRQDKMAPERLKIISKYIDDEMLSWDDPADADKIKSFIKSLGSAESGLGLEKKSGAGMTPPEKKAADNETPPVKGAKKAPNGNWYVQKDGKWFLVRNK